MVVKAAGGRPFLTPWVSLHVNGWALEHGTLEHRTLRHGTFVRWALRHGTFVLWALRHGTFVLWALELWAFHWWALELWAFHWWALELRAFHWWALELRAFHWWALKWWHHFHGVLVNRMSLHAAITGVSGTTTPLQLCDGLMCHLEQRFVHQTVPEGTTSTNQKHPSDSGTLK